jgi:hypothetical protein
VRRNSTIATHGKPHTDDAVVEQPELCCHPRASGLNAAFDGQSDRGI